MARLRLTMEDGFRTITLRLSDVDAGPAPVLEIRARMDNDNMYNPDVVRALVTVIKMLDDIQRKVDFIAIAKEL